MPLYENASCPVCSLAFEKGDDVVFCPECGTPHHRECYASLGRCANAHLHASGYDFYKDKKEKEQAQSGVPVPAPFPEPQKNENGEENKNPFNPVFSSAPAETPFENSSEEIGGINVADLAAAVRVNAKRFIDVFKKQQDKKIKTGWNWGAFLFGSLYFFFRKMYKQAISLMCFFGALLIGANLAYAKLAPEANQAMAEFMELMSNGSNEAAMENYQSVVTMADYPKAAMVSYVVLGTIIMLRIVLALFADRIYFKSISTLINNVTEKLNSGSTFQTPMLGAEVSTNLTQEQLKRLYLSRKGGASAFSPLLAMMVFMTVIQYIAQYL